MSLASYMVSFGWSTVHFCGWMIRLNPDVLIRQSEWILRAMTNTSRDAINGSVFSADPTPGSCIRILVSAPTSSQ